MKLSMANAEVVLEHLYERLEAATEEYSTISNAAADARSEYKLKWSVAFSEADGAMDLRKAQADVASFVAFRDKERLEAREKALRAVLDSLKEGMGAARTLMASSRV